MFTIGEFSKVAGLTVKTLRFYHQEGVLEPSFVDPGTGYRYYDEQQLEAARLITFLRSFEFPLAEIRQILERGIDDEEAMLRVVQQQRDLLHGQIKHFRRIVRLLDQFLSEEKEARAMAQSTFQIEEKPLDSMLIAGIRMRGRYRDCGQGFGKLGRSAGRRMCGKPFLLHYDSEYKEEDADFETCVPIQKEVSVDGIDVRRLRGGRCVSLLHRGAYDTLGRSYARILEYIRERGYTILMPTREVYLKGPGILFKGNPKNYLTEIQMLVQ